MSQAIEILLNILAIRDCFLFSSSERKKKTTLVLKQRISRLMLATINHIYSFNL